MGIEDNEHYKSRQLSDEERELVALRMGVTPCEHFMHLKYYPEYWMKCIYCGWEPPMPAGKKAQ